LPCPAKTGQSLPPDPGHGSKIIAATWDTGSLSFFRSQRMDLRKVVREQSALLQLHGHRGWQLSDRMVTIRIIIATNYKALSTVLPIVQI
jgi:hypothetical protein